MTQTKLGGAHTTIVGGRTGKGSRDRSTVEGVGCAGIEHAFTFRTIYPK